MLGQHPPIRGIAEGAGCIGAGLPGVLADYAWGGASRFVDMGAALGSVLSALMELHPSVPGVLFDQPQVLALPRPPPAFFEKSLFP